MRPDELRPAPTPPRAAPTHLTPARVMAAGICALVATIGISRFAYTPLLPVMRDQAGLSAIDAGWLATVNYVGYLGGALIASTIPSLQRKFTLYRVGLVVAVAATAAMGLVSGMPAWVALRLLAGLGSTAGPLLGAGLALNWLLRHGHRPDLGIYYGGVGLGIVVSGVVAALMGAAHLGWATQWIVFAALALLFLVPAVAWMPSPTEAADRGVALPAPAPPPHAWMALFHVAYFAGGVVFVVTATFIVDIIRHMDGISLPGTWVWVAIGAVAVPSCFAWDRIGEAMGGLRALTLAYGLQTASCALLTLGSGPLPVVLAAILYGGTVMGIVSLTLAIVGRLYPADPARAMARLTLSYGTAQILGPIVAGTLSHTSGGYGSALLVAAGIGVAGTLVSLMLRPPA